MKKLINEIAGRQSHQTTVSFYLSSRNQSKMDEDKSTNPIHIINRDEVQAMRRPGL